MPQMNSLEENFLDQFGMTKRIDEQADIRNLEYSTTGDMLSYTTDDALKIYSSVTGCLKNVISVKMDTMKYFQSNTVLHSRHDTIYYLSVYDNKYLRKFEGHGGRVFSLSVNPLEDLFMSMRNKVIDIWDIRYKNPVCEIGSQGKLGAMSTGHEYALTDNNFVYIFDRRSDVYPIMVRSIKPNFYKSMWYAGGDSYIALSSKQGYTFLDSSGEPVGTCASENVSGDIIDESNTLLYSSSNLIFAYKILDNRRVGRLEVDKECNAIKSNPSYPQFACSTGNGIRIWSIATEQIL